MSKKIIVEIAKKCWDEGLHDIEAAPHASQLSLPPAFNATFPTSTLCHFFPSMMESKWIAMTYNIYGHNPDVSPQALYDQRIDIDALKEIHTDEERGKVKENESEGLSSRSAEYTNPIAVNSPPKLRIPCCTPKFAVKENILLNLSRIPLHIQRGVASITMLFFLAIISSIAFSCTLPSSTPSTIPPSSSLYMTGCVVTAVVILAFILIPLVISELMMKQVMQSTENDECNSKKTSVFDSSFGKKASSVSPLPSTTQTSIIPSTPSPPIGFHMHFSSAQKWKTNRIKLSPSLEDIMEEEADDVSDMDDSDSRLEAASQQQCVIGGRGDTESDDDFKQMQWNIHKKNLPLPSRLESRQLFPVPYGLQSFSIENEPEGDEAQGMTEGCDQFASVPAGDLVDVKKGDIIDINPQTFSDVLDSESDDDSTLIDPLIVAIIEEYSYKQPEVNDTDLQCHTDSLYNVYISDEDDDHVAVN